MIGTALRSNTSTVYLHSQIAHELCPALHGPVVANLNISIGQCSPRKQ
jgi:hypothetical protein